VLAELVGEGLGWSYVHFAPAPRLELRPLQEKPELRTERSEMSFLGWLALAGALLLLMGLSSAYLQRLPVSTAAIYLVLGVAIGPLGLGWLSLDVTKSASDWLERLTEVAVIVALFIGGLKLRLPFRDPAWVAAWRLAGPTMLVTIVGVALAGHLLLGLPPALAVLLGSILAPTDPVLASAVAVNDAADHDRMRYGLSGEAGLNDGMAFPFVVFSLSWAAEGEIGGWIGAWFLHRVVWAIPAGLVVGFWLGWGVGRLAIGLRARHRDTAAPSDFLALALVALSYVGAELIGAWGFLAAFAAGVGLRHAEVQVSHEESAPKRLVEPPAERLVGPEVAPEQLKEPAVAAGVMLAETVSFGDTVERLLEVLLVVLVGVALASHWDPRGVALALALFVVIRPAASWLLLSHSPTTPSQRGLMGWFGIRGIGSLYYLSYALHHGTFANAAGELGGITITVVALSILVHGASARPLLVRYERRLAASVNP
jgi:NhaP-type Na+/H+ or K+/H+ antiporter